MGRSQWFSLMDKIQAVYIQIRKCPALCSEVARLRVFLSMNSSDIKQTHFGEYQSFYQAYSEEPQFGSLGCGFIQREGGRWQLCLLVHWLPRDHELYPPELLCLR